MTFSRLGALPVFVVVFYLPFDWARPAACFIFAAAAITDWADGFFARRMGLDSRFGAFLDPVADKLIVATALVLIVQTDPHWYVALAAAIIIGREITISALREWLSETGMRSKVKVSRLGKTKTAFQMTGLSFMIFLQDLWGLPIYDIGLLLIIISAALTLWSMFDYWRAAWPLLTSE
jgi:CDP-diacylglycerol--glycerol-3-phosphate 3-phosphatidyltransferase/cardiolipin synthase